jgi:hypothetical protein
MKYFIILTTIITVLFINHLSSCPFEFSPDDQRPFFEQYDTKTDPIIPQK